MKPRFYLVSIVLTDIQPTVSRKIVVPDTISLDRLHDVIQIVMGWDDMHLHSFVIDGKTYSEKPETREDGMEEAGIILGDLVKNVGAKFTYTYDFGDDWHHQLSVEKVYTALPDEAHAVISCVGGKRACPPEDVGGAPGYEMFCNVLKDVNHPEYDNYREWMGSDDESTIDFDPEEFDQDYANYELFKYLRWSRKRLVLFEAMPE